MCVCVFGHCIWMRWTLREHAEAPEARSGTVLFRRMRPRSYAGAMASYIEESSDGGATLAFTAVEDLSFVTGIRMELLGRGGAITPKRVFRIFAIALCAWGTVSAFLFALFRHSSNFAIGMFGMCAAGAVLNIIIEDLRTPPTMTNIALSFSYGTLSFVGMLAEATPVQLAALRRIDVKNRRLVLVYKSDKVASLPCKLQPGDSTDLVERTNELLAKFGRASSGYRLP